MTLHGSGVRDIVRVLGVSSATVDAEQHTVGKQHT